jgi:cell division protein FtsB
MNPIDKIKERLPSLILPFTSIMLVTYFAVHLMNGSRGIGVYFKLKDQKIVYENERDSLKTKLAFKESKIGLLSPKHLDPDMLDEEIRYKLGLSDPQEKIILMGLPEKQIGDQKRTIIIVPPREKK